MQLSHKRILFATIIIFSILVVCFIRSYYYAGKDLAPALKNIKQDAFVYLNPQTENQLLIPAAAQKQAFQGYIQRFFKPWNETDLSKSGELNDIKQTELGFIKEYMRHPGWGENQHKHSKMWIENIVTNMDMATFPNHIHKAITVYNAHVRVLPTHDPSFAGLNIAGQGYPFDDLQASLVAPGTPILILQITKSGAWYLILTHNIFGWMSAQNIAYVDAAFIYQWQTGAYVAPLQDQIPISDQQYQFRFLSRLGSVYPLQKTAANNFTILIPVVDSEKNAMIKTAEINSQAATIMPLPVTAKNIASVANHLMGDNYGWGDIYNYRDCSSTMVDLFTPFGIWLPRSSNEQIKMGEYIALKKYNAREKLKIITDKGVPFFTLLHLQGHIILYIGQYQGQAYVFHDFWGMHTQSIFGPSGRSVVGQTAITPLNFGAGYINIRHRIIDAVQDMTILGKENLNQ